VERLYTSVCRGFRDRGVYGCIEASFSVPVQRVPLEEFLELASDAAAKPDQVNPRETNWGSMRFRSLPYRRSVKPTRLYSPEYLQEVFGWEVDQDEWDGILCEVEPPARVDVEPFMRPLCLKWRSESDEALLKKARGIKSFWTDAIKQIPAGEVGFIYLAYPEGCRAPIADARTRQIMKELNEVWHAGTYAHRQPPSAVYMLVP
jgi:hypothetical protein